ncbi:MAG: hypothetical protein V4591_09095 [Bdellovibrionota bacterium]
MRKIKAFSKVVPMKSRNSNKVGRLPQEWRVSFTSGEYIAIENLIKI